MFDRIKELFVFDKKNLIRIGIAAVIAIVDFILIMRSYPEAAAGIVLFFLMLIPTFEITGKGRYIADIIFPVYASLFGLYYFQLGIIVDTPFMKSLFSFWGFLLVQNRVLYEILLIICAYYLCRLLFMSPKVAAIACQVPFLLLSVIDYFVYMFRGHELVAYDFLSVGTAANVAGGYTYNPVQPIVFMVLPFVLYTMFFVHLKMDKPMFNRLIGIPVFAVLTALCAWGGYAAVHAWFDAGHQYSEWGYNPSCINGYYNTFVKSFDVFIIEEPEGYSVEALNAELDSSGVGTELVKAQPDDTANVIVILSESYADLSLYADKTGKTDVPDPYWRSLMDQSNTLSGMAFASVFGGNTCNTEYEVLTGMSMAFVPDGSVPYQSYIADNKIYSMAQFLKDSGYTTRVMHPYIAEGWNRTNVYPLMGFDDMMFIDDFEYGNDDIVNGKISDSCAYRNLIKTLDAKKPGEKNFTFMITIQNHSPYDNPDFEVTPYTNALSDHDNLTVNSFNTLISKSDAALKELTDYLSKSDEKYVVLIFGDHQPSVGLDTTEDYSPVGKAWQVPYLIWANYDIDKSSAGAANYGGAGFTSLNYLALDTLETAGLELNSYFKLLKHIREDIPVINSVGYFSNKENSIIDKGYFMNDEDKKAIGLYNCFEYNIVFDKGDNSIMKGYYIQNGQ
ncbi:MAG: LTA synthase family protein [Clostridiales bacterium]|nr:LTA synthase family protein [Clostridiales bacterium]